MTAVAETLVTERRCGTCSMCCKLPLIVELEKPAGAWCRYCKPGKGCGSYVDRPQVCRDFHCGYLTEASLGEEWKPTVARMLLLLEHDQNRVSVLVDPQRPDAWRQAPYYQQIKRWAVQAVPTGGHIHVCVGPRTIVVLPDRDADLGVVGPDEAILTTRRPTPGGVHLDVTKVRQDDPRLATLGQ